MLQFRLKLLALLFATALLPLAARGADGKWNLETLVHDLAQPNGLAVQPSTEDLFISESGTGKILALSPAKPEARRVAIEGFPLPASAKDSDPAKRGGVAGLGFLNEQVLAVAFSQANHKPALAVYQLPERGEGEAKALNFDATKQLLGPAQANAEDKSSAQDSTGVGSYFALTVSPFSLPGLYVTNPGSNRGWMFKADIRNHSSLDELKPFMATKATPLAITTTRRGVLAVALNTVGAKDTESTVAFYNAKTGGVIASFSAPLADIVSLAYSPDSGRLYAASLSRAKPAEAGIYRLDGATIENRAGMKAVLVAAVDRPTALAFTVGNTLYATAFGSAATDAKIADAKAGDSARGTLIKITGEL